ncbi:hypothetical protein ACFQPG_09655 [Sphingomonas sp. GCM10030256]|uniref:hypothetical protein n=1 Tax=Sphingomonas sp. GCM10030256 TaxID=3273427 RepID=UPI00361D4ED4
MLIALAALPFLAGLWLAAVVIASAVEEDGAKIVAALRGRSLLAEPAVSTRPVVVQFASRRVAARRPMRVEAQLRAAA